VSASTGYSAAPPASDLRTFFQQTWAVIVSTQPAPVRDGLRAERSLVNDLLRRSAYRSLVEVGCADGSLLLSATLRNGLSYIGLDLADGAVAATRAALAATRATLAGTSGIALRADVGDLPGLRLPLLPPALVAFPFNVFGNLPDPQRGLTAVATAGADILLLTYDTGPAATEIRSEYYAACGLSGTLTEDESGVHFTAGAFRSSVYHPPVLSGWLRCHGFRVSVARYGAAGLAYHGWCEAPSNR